jgi:hypothetical protein
MSISEVPLFEPDGPDELEPFELDPQVVALLPLAARRRRMDPLDLLAVLVDCDRRGVEPLWR